RQERLTARVQAQRLYTLRAQPPRVRTLKRETESLPRPMKPITEIAVQALRVITTNHPVRISRRVHDTHIDRPKVRRKQPVQPAPHLRQAANCLRLQKQR